MKLNSILITLLSASTAVARRGPSLVSNAISYRHRPNTFGASRCNEYNSQSSPFESVYDSVYEADDSQDVQMVSVSIICLHRHYYASFM